MLFFASQAQYVETSCNMQKPTTNYVNVANNEMRAWFPNDREEGEFLTLSHWRKTIKTVNYPFLIFFPNHLFLPEFGWGSYYTEWEEYGKKIELGRAPILEERVLTPWERKHPKKYAHSFMH